MILQLAVNTKYFNEILAGVKTEEFRLCNEYWSNRLIGKAFEKVIITLGYPAADDVTKRLEFKWSGYSIKTITHEHFFSGGRPVQVFAIPLIKT